MLVSEVIGRARNMAGDVAAVQMTNAALYPWIDDAIKEIIIQNELCQKTATQNLVVGTSTYVLPTDIFKLYSVVVNSEKIKVYSLQEWEQRYAGVGGSSGPVGNAMTLEAYVWAGSITLFPAPDQTYVMKINYIYEPAAVAADAFDLKTIIPDTYHLRIVTYMLAQYKLMDDDIDGYNLFMQQFQSGVLDLKQQQIGEADLYPSISVASRDMGDDGGYPYYG